MLLNVIYNSIYCCFFWQSLLPYQHLIVRLSIFIIDCVLSYCVSTLLVLTRRTPTNPHLLVHFLSFRRVIGQSHFFVSDYWVYWPNWWQQSSVVHLVVYATQVYVSLSLCVQWLFQVHQLLLVPPCLCCIALTLNHLLTRFYHTSSFSLLVSAVGIQYSSRTVLSLPLWVLRRLWPS